MSIKIDEPLDLDLDTVFYVNITGDVLFIYLFLQKFSVFDCLLNTSETLCSPNNLTEEITR